MDYAELNVAICPNIEPIIAHFHPGFDEIYFVLDGWIHLKTYDQKMAYYAEQRLGQMERFLPGEPLCGGPIDLMVLKTAPVQEILWHPGKLLHHPGGA